MKAVRTLKGFVKDDEAANGMAKIISGLIMVAIALLIALVLVSPVADQATSAKNSANTTSSTDALLDLVPLIFVAATLTVGVGFLIAGLRDVGGT